MREVFIVFAYDKYYPTGLDDVKGVYFTQEAADERVTQLRKYSHKWDYVECHEFTVLDSYGEYVL
jgi:hypothetical protein